MGYLALALCALLVPAQLQGCSAENQLLEAVKLLERLSEEGFDVSAQVRALNEALELCRANKPEEAEQIIQQVTSQLREYEQQLPSYRIGKWLRVGATTAILLAFPPLFYYFFPRAYALAWAYSRRKWLVKKKVGRSGSRR
ncbi:MAG: hypothetical protein QXV98_00590 [Thermofilaceae archaeon]